MRKKLLITLLIVLVALIITGFWLNHYLNSDKVRTQIISLAKTHLGRDVELNGPIGLSLFPSVGIKLEKIVVGNPATIQSNDPFVTADAVRISVGLLPLISQQLVVDALDVQNANIHMIQQGATNNWQFSNSTAVSTQKVPEKKEQGADNASSWEVAVSEVAIDNTTVYWQQDKKAPMVFHINTLKTNDVAMGRPFSIDFDGSLKSTAPAIDIQAKLKTTATIDSIEQIYSFKPVTITIQAKQLPGFVKPMDLDGQLAIEVKKGMIAISDIQLALDKSKITGQINMAQDMQKVNFDLRADTLDMSRYLPASGEKSSASSSTSTRQTLPSAPEAKNNSALQTMAVDGQIAIGHLSYTPWEISNIATKISATKGVWQFSDMSASLYQGTYQGSAQVNLQGAAPRIALNSKFQGISIEKLLVALGKKASVTGVGDLQLNITTSGQNANAILQQLNGTTSFKVAKGVYHGMDINFWWQNAQALIAHKLPSLKNSGETTFEKLSASFAIHNGVAHSNDTSINTTSVTALGVGDVNLPAQTINYHVKLTEAGNDKNTIPLIVQGPLSSPVVTVDPKFLEDMAVKQVKDVIENKLPLGKEGAAGAELLKGTLQNLIGH